MQSLALLLIGAGVLVLRLVLFLIVNIIVVIIIANDVIDIIGSVGGQHVRLACSHYRYYCKFGYSCCLAGGNILAGCHHQL